jgi:hypothetical protein
MRTARNFRAVLIIWLFRGSVGCSMCCTLKSFFDTERLFWFFLANDDKKTMLIFF